MYLVLQILRKQFTMNSQPGSPTTQPCHKKMPPTEGRDKPVEPTISDDRTRGSLFEQRGDKWVALGPRETPTLAAPDPSLDFPLCEYPGWIVRDNVFKDVSYADPEETLFS